MILFRSTMVKQIFPVALFLATFRTGSGLDLQCGQWYSAPCVCESDIRFCPEGVDGATDDILPQNSLWGHVQGYYSYEAFVFLFGLTKAPSNKFPYYGYLNHTIVGSRDYQHRYEIVPPAPENLCGSPGFPEGSAPGPICGVNGYFTATEGFATSSYERDGSLVTISFVNSNATVDSPWSSTKELLDPNYLLIPIDNSTYFGSAVSSEFFVTETFVFTDHNYQVANAVQDVYQLFDSKTILVQTTRFELKRLPDSTAFTNGILQAYNDYNIVPSERALFPMTQSCSNYPNCPTEEAWCTVDPTCSESPYQEPNGTLSAGPIAGICVASFVVLVAILYCLHKRIVSAQANRTRKIFARRIAETVTLQGDNRLITPEALAEEFHSIQKKNPDGTVSKDELWQFINSGKAGTINKSDFNALFAVLDSKHDGKVDFLEFCSYMGQCYDEFEEYKGHNAVTMKRPTAVRPSRAQEEAARRKSTDALASALASRASASMSGSSEFDNLSVGDGHDDYEEKIKG